MGPRLLAISLLLVAAGAPTTSARPTVVALRLSGSVQPATVRYLERGLKEAERRHAELVIVELDTPGGLEVSLRQMTTAITTSPRPVAVFVAPSGARAASAGFFLLLAADVAAMAPGTNTGAAHPVTLGAKNEKTVEKKAVEDAAALARSLAAERRRPVEWAERAVTESKSFSVAEALERRLIDLVAANRAALLDALDGRPIRRWNGGEEVLRLDSPEVVELAPSWAERVLMLVADPSIAYLLLMLGMLGILVELMHPGSFAPGLVGAIALLLAFYGFSVLPVSWVGALMMLLGLALFVAEVFVVSYGLLTLGGLACFVVGSIMLVEPQLPGIAAISPALVLPTAFLVALVTIALGQRALRAQRRPAPTGAEALIGRTGEAASAGKVFVFGEYWDAVASRPMSKGARVRVVGVEGNRLIVQPS